MTNLEFQLIYMHCCLSNVVLNAVGEIGKGGIVGAGLELGR